MPPAPSRGPLRPGQRRRPPTAVTRVRQQTATVTRLRDTAKQRHARHRAAGSCTVAAQQVVAVEDEAR
jgi:hypothetical protein